LAAGKSQREVAKKYNVSRGTLQNRAAGRHKLKPGRQTVLTQVEELAIVDHITKLAQWGFPLDKTDLRMIVKVYLDKRGRSVKQFKSNYPGHDWSLSFMTRHNDRLSHRLCQNIAPKRAMVNPEDIKNYFKNLETTLKDIPPCNIIMMRQIFQITQEEKTLFFREAQNTQKEQCKVARVQQA